MADSNLNHGFARKLLTPLSVAAMLFATAADANFPGMRWQPCENLPPASARHPLNDFVKVIEKTIPGERMWAACHIVKRDGVLYGCTYRIPHYLVWRVFYNSSLNAGEKACTRLIEYGHMPPNRWSNPTVEGMVRHTGN